ncbi:hypothetical protein JMJ77_0010570 [Colletotrichum scovillei]|uniref:Uncharacterized protein n=1 Tax=Colletotrichum scovillei TaxID=1209932 RepID=A0A9P7QVV2_9PEZI|nr:hypothetical protein JMJ78_0011952 [Colletotrichum scovillei]KAG7042472.1 hypothetical protein JMJ77_0010570 [Colletotrichum scovillei]KAG7062505.1 hypothetical protein JMJ76_0006778 [Colletotrichum scovillei]
MVAAKQGTRVKTALFVRRASSE